MKLGCISIGILNRECAVLPPSNNIGLEHYANVSSYMLANVYDDIII